MHFTDAFFTDPDFANDPKLEAMNELSLNYIFYESTAGIRLLTQFEQEQQKQLAKEQQNQQRNSLDVL